MIVYIFGFVGTFVVAGVGAALCALLPKRWPFLSTSTGEWVNAGMLLATQFLAGVVWCLVAGGPATTGNSVAGLAVLAIVLGAISGLIVAHLASGGSLRSGGTGFGNDTWSDPYLC